MLIKITDKCSMGCTHCLSDCTEQGKHMTFDTFKEAIAFNNNLAVSALTPMLISGGEPFEHPEIEKFLDYLIEVCNSIPNLSEDFPLAIIATNGQYMSTHPEVAEHVAKSTKHIGFQVVIDDRYYPIHVDDEALKKQPGVNVFYGVASIYPQGRAITNNLPYSKKCSSCYNVRALAKQFGNTPITLEMILMQMFMRGHLSCTPHIDIDGNIKVGESRLCPVCSNIYKPKEKIVEDIINFNCHQCDFINKNLPPEYRRFVE